MLFQERLISWWIIVPLGLAILTLLSIVLYKFARQGTLSVLPLIIAFFLLLVLLNFAVLEVQVTEEAFTARYGIFRMRIPSEQITEVEITTAPLLKYGGIGLRWGVDGSIAYTTSFGTAVRIERRTRRPFVVSTHRPQELIAALLQIKGYNSDR
jgi:hypothetical protein